MADDIATINGKKAFAHAAGRPGWHGLGQPLPEGVDTSKAAIEFSGLDYPVYKIPMHSKRVDGGYEPVPGIYVTGRIDKATNKTVYFGPVSERYSILQNVDAFDALDSWLQDGRVRYETAGALGEGERIFILARVGEDFLIGGKDPVRPYILLSNSHDGSGATTIKNVETRVVCANTLAVALRERASQVTVRHVGDIKARVEAAKEALNLVDRRRNEMMRRFDQLAQEKASEELQKQVVDLLVPELTGTVTTRQRDAFEQERLKLWRHMSHSKTVEFGGGMTNRWGLFNAATEWIDWTEVRKGHNLETGGKKALEKRMLFSLEGDGAKTRDSIFKTLTRDLVSV